MTITVVNVATLLRGGTSVGAACYDVIIASSKSFKLFSFWTAVVMLWYCAGIDGGNDVDSVLLTGIYERVAECEFKPGCDHVSQVVRIEQMIVGKKPVRCLLS